MSLDLPWRLRCERHVAVVHAHTAGRLGGIGLAFASQRRIPFVITIHGGVLDLPGQLKASFSNGPQHGWDWGRVFGFLLRSHHIFEEADAILTCNPREAQLWREHYPRKRIVVQPHGVPLAKYQEDHRNAALTAFPQLQNFALQRESNCKHVLMGGGGLSAIMVTERRKPFRREALSTFQCAGKDFGAPSLAPLLSPLLVCVGRIDPVKNQAWLLDQARPILERHPRSVLVFAGPCTDEAYGELIHHKIRTLGLSQRVVLTGGLPPDDPRLIGLLQLSSAVIVPSVSETFGLVVLEAWAAGAPVLSSRTSGPTTLIRHADNGWLFDLQQPETFHSGLDLVLSQPAFAEEMVARGAVAAAQYSVEAAAERIKRLYEELINEKRLAEECPCVT